MKKLMFLLVFAGFSFGAFAQEVKTNEVPTLKHKVVTNGFWDNWFVGFGGDFISNFSSQEIGVSGSPFASERYSWGGSVTLGKWATPSVGVRAKVGFGWGRQINSAEADFMGPDYMWDNDLTNPKFSQLNVSLQPLFNLHNIFAGYKPRVWNTILYASVGCRINFVTDDSSPMVGLGWLNVFNVSDRFHFNVDLYADMGHNDLDGNSAVTATGMGACDLQLGASVGFGVNLGKVGWDNAPDVDAIMAMNKAQLDALNASLAEQQEENARMQAIIKNHKCPEAKQVTEIIASKASVFFNIGKSKVASKKDLVNVQELVKCAKGKTIVVTGYADSKTGTASYNQTLSEKRAQAVADELVKMGVSRDKIEVVGKGGVEELSPISYNRRVVVSLK
ncbi:MAG: OmpA family protein [Bacteroidaceae bacterium]|nr:OmpA family protein [Bacteroidaceae bacterium]